MATPKQKMQLFAVLLAVVVILTLSFATGWLRFGLAGPLIYIIYVLAGLLTAVLTFGLLSSTGRVNGDHHGVAVRLSGAIVALVVVVAGGAVYERYFHTGSEFDLLLLFYSDTPAQLESLRGEVVVIAGNVDMEAPLTGNGRTLVRSIPTRFLGQPMDISLNVPGYQIIEWSPKAFTNTSPVRVEVSQVRAYIDPDTSLLQVTLEEATVINFLPRPDDRLLNFKLRFRSSASLPILLSNRAKLHILSNSGSTLMEVPLKGISDETSVRPGISFNHFEGFISRSDFSLASSDRMAQIIFEPDLAETPDQAPFTSETFTLGPSTIEDLSR